MANDTSPSRHRFVDSHCGLSACWSGCVSSPGTQHKTKASTAFPSRATFSPTYCPSSRARQLQSYKLPIVTCTAASVVQTAHRHVHGSFSRTNCPSSRARQLQSYKLPIVTCTAASVVQTSHRHVHGSFSRTNFPIVTCTAASVVQNCPSSGAGSIVFLRHFPQPSSPPVFLRHFPSLPPPASALRSRYRFNILCLSTKQHATDSTTRNRQDNSSPVETHLTLSGLSVTGAVTASTYCACR